MNLLADWTTAGPYRELTWLTVVFTVAVLITLILTLFELRDSWVTWRAISKRVGNGKEIEALRVLSLSSIFRSVGRVTIQILFLLLATSTVISSIHVDSVHFYWYRVIFIVSFLTAEVLLWLLVLNELIARRKLAELIMRGNLDEDA